MNTNEINLFVTDKKRHLLLYKTIFRSCLKRNCVKNHSVSVFLGILNIERKMQNSKSKLKAFNFLLTFLSLSFNLVKLFTNSLKFSCFIFLSDLEILLKWEFAFLLVDANKWCLFSTSLSLYKQDTNIYLIS